MSLLDIFTKIYGVGPKTAQKFINSGISSLEELDTKKDELLNDKQKLGLKYYEDINKRIPREEIDSYNAAFSEYFREAKTSTNQHDALYEIVGSYRRNAKDSGDIDVIITNPGNDKAVFQKFIELLTNAEIILHKLTDGDKQIKLLVICRLPGKPARRVDFMYSPYNEYPFAILYFTGSKDFNTAMRHHALSQGYTMNEHRIENVSSKEAVTTIKTEKDIFKFLSLKYIEPKDRIDKTSIIKTKLIKPKTLKVKSEVTENSKFIDGFRKNHVEFLNTQSQKSISDFVRAANIYYHTKAKPLISDSDYDIIRDYLEEKYPDDPALLEVGAPDETSATKTKLPYEMSSMDKIKPGTPALKKWLTKYNTPSLYVSSIKLDGVSGMYDGKNKKMYRRGDGTIGHDISHLLPYFKLPKDESVIRGEFVISKTNFSKHFEGKANARNSVAGIINSKTIDPELIKYVDFVAYEVIEPILKPSEQFEHLNKIYPDHVCQHTFLSSLNEEKLIDMLTQWTSASEYEMDGIVIYHDEIYSRKSGNPKHAFAFKMNLVKQFARSTVIDVEWTASVNRLLKPVVVFKPVNIRGFTVQRATADHASFIEKNKINVGSVIEVVLSGHVIPHISKVIEPSASPKLPDVPYVWDDTHVNVLLPKLDSDSSKTDEQAKQEKIVLQKNILSFLDDVDGLGSGFVMKLIDAGFDSIPKILSMEKEDFVKIPGFGDKRASKIMNSIKSKINNMSLPLLMANCNTFGKGLGEKKLKAIMDTYPSILVSPESNKEKIAKLVKVNKIATKTAELFVTNIPNFIDFMEKANLTHRISTYTPEKKITTTHPLNDKFISFTGVRDKNLESKLRSYGAIIRDEIKADTYVLITNSKTSTSKKMEDAQKLTPPVPIMTLEEFISSNMT